MTVNPVRLVVAGAGLRGLGYARHATASGQARVTAVAEPDPSRRARFAAEFGVPPEQVYADWRDLAAAGRVGDAVVIATQDQMHNEPTIAFAELGYHILLEKPMATTEADALRIAAAVEKADVIFAVCHVMRYTPYSKALKEVLDDGVIGRLVSVQHLEPIGWWHYAHSFVRGNWRNSHTSGPLLLTKSCHDIDWLLHLFGSAPTQVSSFGGLSHFRADQRPEGATSTCLSCPVEPSCPYSAPASTSPASATRNASSGRCPRSPPTTPPPASWRRCGPARTAAVSTPAPTTSSTTRWSPCPSRTARPARSPSPPSPR
ncbi:Gfo/Idh/MocA family protein [Plantactinospora veratri]